MRKDPGIKVGYHAVFVLNPYRCIQRTVVSEGTSLILNDHNAERRKGTWYEYTGCFNI